MSKPLPIRNAHTMLASGDSWDGAYAVAYDDLELSGDPLKGNYTNMCHAGYHPMGVLGYRCPSEDVRYKYGVVFTVAPSF